MKLNFALIALLALMVMILSPVQAQTIQFANPGAVAERDYMIYYGNGTMAAFVNSTSTVELDGDLDYIITMKPISSNFFDDPGDWMTNTAFPWLTTNMIPIILAGWICVMVFGRR